MIPENFYYRIIKAEEAEYAARMEQICFPPEEAWPKELMIERIIKIPEMTLVVEDTETKKIVGMINGIATNEDKFCDDFIADVSRHNPNGRNLMITGVQVLPEYRHKGLAKELMMRYLRQEKAKGRSKAFLTCLEDKIEMYKKMGFQDYGIVSSSWAGMKWHEMTCVLSSTFVQPESGQIL